MEAVRQNAALYTSAELAASFAAVLTVVHVSCCLLLAYLDLSGKWAEYRLNKARVPSWSHYVVGFQSYFRDMLLIFVPGLTALLFLTGNYSKITNCQDSYIVGFLKMISGYILGKLWAFGAHRVLHFPKLYWIHKAHHAPPATLAASCAWKDSVAEYCIMEMPAFAMQLALFPTHFVFHAGFFAWHGWGAAGDHCAMSAPGWLGWAFDGEYHYYHHANFAVNYAEMEFLDKMFGTHHSQFKQMKEAKEAKLS
eukprot:SRR837773.21836.p1 GENE.SRR837773.21836~~SRR837773.21836.p1  ORF type:complete len:252 (+),score=99.88 SRR837773.21836:39-794(+)